MKTKGLRLSLFAMSVLLGGACFALTPFLNGTAAEVKAVADDSTTYTDTSVSQVMFQNGNALLQIYLTTSDWASAGSTAFPGTTWSSFDFMSKIKIYTDDTTSYTMADLHASGSQVYYNMWGVYGQGSLAVQLSQTGDAVKKVVIPSGTHFPSLATTGYAPYTSGTPEYTGGGANTGYVTTSEMTFLQNTVTTGSSTSFKTTIDPYSQMSIRYNIGGSDKFLWLYSEALDWKSAPVNTAMWTLMNSLNFYSKVLIDDATIQSYIDGGHSIAENYLSAWDANSGHWALDSFTSAMPNRITIPAGTELPSYYGSLLGAAIRTDFVTSQDVTFFCDGANDYYPAMARPITLTESESVTPTSAQDCYIIYLHSSEADCFANADGYNYVNYTSFPYASFRNHVKINGQTITSIYSAHSYDYTTSTLPFPWNAGTGYEGYQKPIVIYGDKTNNRVELRLYSKLVDDLLAAGTTEAAKNTLQISIDENAYIGFKGYVATGAGSLGTAYTKSYAVSLDSDGDGTADSSVSTKWNSTLSKPADPSKAYYTFLGWYLGSTLFDFTTPITSAITLSAKFEKKSSDWGKEFLADFASVCSTTATGEAVTSSLQNAWNSTSTSFALLSSSEQALVKAASANASGSDLEKAVSLYDYILAKYGVDSFSSQGGNYASRTITSLSKPSLFASDGTKDLSSGVMLLSFMGLATLAVGAFFIRRKKD